MNFEKGVSRKDLFSGLMTEASNFLPDPDDVEKAVVSAFNDTAAPISRGEALKRMAVGAVGATAVFAGCKGKEKPKELGIDELIINLRSPDVRVRRFAVSHISAAGELKRYDITPATVALVDSLADNDLRVRRRAAYALQFVTPNSSPSVLRDAVKAVMSVALTDEVWYTHFYGLKTLANLAGSVDANLQSEVMDNMLLMLEKVDCVNEATDVIEKVAVNITISETQKARIERILKDDRRQSLHSHNTLLRVLDASDVAK